MANLRIFYIPIEPLEERYTASWYKNIPAYFQSKGATVFVIDGVPLEGAVKVGTFLDINSTIHYKCSQMKRLAQYFNEGKVKDGDVFFFGDIEFWGLESLRLMAQVNKVKIFIYGVLHAASYSIEDTFSVAEDYQKYTELGWIAACDTVFVGSAYHKRAFDERRVLPMCHSDFIELIRLHRLMEKVVVTGLPMFKADYDDYIVKKKNQVVIAGRLDYERRPNLGMDFAYLLKKKYGDKISIVMTVSSPHMRSNRKWLVDYANRLKEDGVLDVRVGLNKVAYHQVLAGSKVLLSTTVEENFGYSCMEACYYNCAPVVPNGFSYPELLCHDKRLLYSNEDEIIPLIEKILFEEDQSIPMVKRYSNHYFLTMDRMWEEIEDEQ